MRKGWLFSGLAILALVSTLWARQGVLHLTDGSQLSGDIDDTDPDKVTITLHGVQESLPRDQIRAIDYPGSIEDQFQDKMFQLGPRDVNGRLEVANWAAEQRRFDLARQAAAEAVAIDPASVKARDALRDLGYRAALAARAATRPAASATVLITPIAVEKPYLTLDEVNYIRQLELKPDDSFQVDFVHNVRQRFLDLGVIDAQSFYSKSDMDQARQIMAAGNPALSRDVRIRTDPASLAEFHSRLQPWVLGGCAVSGCHDALSVAGGFGLFTGDESPRAWYTNYYMLQTYIKPAVVGGAEEKLMIDRLHAEDSLLLNYGLLPAMARTPHPKAKNWHPIFVERSDPHYQSFIHWMAVMLTPDGGIYPDIHYRPPWAAHHAQATTQPVAGG